MKKLNKKGFSHVETILLVAVVAVIGVVGFFVYSRSQDKSSKAEGTAETDQLSAAEIKREKALEAQEAVGTVNNRTKSGYLDWRNVGTTKYSDNMISADGWFCSTADFDLYNVSAGGYRMHLEVKSGAVYERVRSSQKYSANGNFDRVCWDRNVIKGKVYRVGYDPEVRVFMHGRYILYNFRAW